MVALQLLGQLLIRQTANGFCGGAIVEVEAYLRDDPACHASRGETPRNRTMFGEHGHSYVYLIYGYHCCVNAVCQPKGVAEAVLIRAVEVTFGEEVMRQNRRIPELRDLTNGPAKLCAAMNIDRQLDTVDLCDVNSPLFIAKNPALELFRKERGPIVTTTRIGISKAADLPLRFYLDGSPFISKRVVGSKLKAKSRIKLNGEGPAK
ncbi:MAG: 3-methyladenine glycosylase [Verrucomicrobiales bacterium]|nr:3-methyladenine glycosylase [Verrucomicrobiales bacterium]